MKSLFTLVLIAITAGAASAQQTAKERLDNSPRHLEYVTLTNASREVSAFIAFPEVKEKATAVLVIHEIFGLTDWVRGVTDQLAEAGYIAIAPDFLSGTAGAGGGDAARGAIRNLSAAQITGDLEAALRYVTNLPACNGKVVVAGFCWGGRQTFNFAAANKQIKAGFVFYGEAVPPDEMKNIQCPIYGFYGERDARITSAVPSVTESMKAAGKTFEPVTYDGAGHGFMRSGETPNGSAADKKAREDAWKRWKELLGKI